MNTNSSKMSEELKREMVISFRHIERLIYQLNDKNMLGDSSADIINSVENIKQLIPAMLADQPVSPPGGQSIQQNDNDNQRDEDQPGDQRDEDQRDEDQRDNSSIQQDNQNIIRDIIKFNNGDRNSLYPRVDYSVIDSLNTFSKSCEELCDDTYTPLNYVYLRNKMFRVSTNEEETDGNFNMVNLQAFWASLDADNLAIMCKEQSLVSPYSFLLKTKKIQMADDLVRGFASYIPRGPHFDSMFPSLPTPSSYDWIEYFVKLKDYDKKIMIDWYNDYMKAEEEKQPCDFY